MRLGALILRIARIHPNIALVMARAWETLRPGDKDAHPLLQHLNRLDASLQLQSIPVGAGSYIVAPANSWVARLYRRPGVYEPAATALSRPLIQPGTITIAVGAAVSSYT